MTQSAPCAYFAVKHDHATLTNLLFTCGTLVTRLKEAHIPATISNTAGLYLCNQLFYSVMHCITANQMSTRAGFIHLPYLDEQTVNEKQPFPGMSRETMMKAVHIAIETSVQV